MSPANQTVRKLMERVAGEIGPSGDIVVSGVTNRYTNVVPGFMFVDCQYPWLDHGRYAGSYPRPSVIVTDRPTVWREHSNVVTVEKVRRAYALILSAAFGHPGDTMELHCVTGTKGKTTTVHLYEAVLRHQGRPTGLMSSLLRQSGGTAYSSGNTTPECEELHFLLSRMLGNVPASVVIEASSIGIAEERLAGLRLKSATLTNLGHDHFTYHGGRGAYQATKARLFSQEYLSNDSVGVVNVDSHLGRSLARSLRDRAVTCGKRGQIRVNASVFGARGIVATIDGLKVRSQLLGMHNLANITSAVALGRALGVAPSAIQAGIWSVSSLPGRLERIGPIGGITAYVDAAHTVESVRAALFAVQQVSEGGLIVSVIGCGGGTDRQKRAPLLRAALALSNFCLVTTDNSRDEDPKRIVEDMLAGVSRYSKARQGRIVVIPDRASAIREAVRAARASGSVVILGRGAETTLTVGTDKVPFDDRLIARASLEAAARLSGHTSRGPSA